MRFELDPIIVSNDFDKWSIMVDAIDSKTCEKEFVTLLGSLCLNVPQCDKALIEKFTEKVLSVVRQVAFVKMYHPTYRTEFVKAIMRLCVKDVVDTVVVYEALLALLVCDDKKVRLTVCNFIVNDIKQRNMKTASVEVNKKAKILLQRWILERGFDHANRGAKMLIQLFRKGIWTDALTVNVLAECCLHKSVKVRCTALRFFLNKSSVGAADDSDNSDSDTEIKKAEKIRKATLKHRVGKKSQTRKKHLEKELNNIKRKKIKKHSKPDSMYLECNVLALQLIRDPQMFAEKLMAKTKSAPHHLKLLQLELISRSIGYHKLQLETFYSFILNLLSPKIMDVTQMLIYAAQAAHEMVSPDDIQPVVKMIADKFVNEGISGEGISLGLNSIREICARCPHAMPDELLPLLLEFRNNRDKNVVSATRSLIRLYRDINPSLLPKNERGRPTEATVDVEMQGDATKLPRAYGDFNVVTFIPGSEIIKVQENNLDEDYEECSEDDDESGEWEDVLHSDDEEVNEIEMKNPEERKKHAEEMSYDHIFNDEEHQAIKKHLVNKAKQAAKRYNKKADVMMEIDSDTGEVIDPNEPTEFVTERAIIHMAKKAKANKEDRIEAIEDGRVDRKKYGFNVNRFNPQASTTNREKTKKKNFMMVKHKKSLQKKNLSLKEKNKMLKDHIMAKAKFLRS